MIRLTSLVTPQTLGKPVNSKTSIVKENEEPEQNVANGLPQTQGDDKITMTRESLKNIVREVMKEEEEYQKIFHKMLAKFGVNSPADLTDDQKKKFFTMVKGIQSELKEREAVKEAELKGGQHKLDVDGDGEIEGSDLAKLRNKNEGKKLKEARDADGNEFPEYDDVKAAVKKMIQNDAVEKLLRNKVVSYLQKEKRFDGAGNTNSSRLFDKVINDLLKH
jgi:hypothetical protein